MTSLLPVLEGLIARRILLNFRVRPELLAPLLPAPFRPQIVRGWGVAGICLIRLEQVRPRWIPGALGLSSENCAHRIAVEWDESGRKCTGIFILRRDSNSRLNALVGGRIFSGIHSHARFSYWETPNRIKLEVQTGKGVRLVRAAVRTADGWWSEGSVFTNLAEASRFFERGSCGWSPDRKGGCEGIELRTSDWCVEPLVVERCESDFFDDQSRFAEGTIEFDCGLMMRHVPHARHVLPPMVVKEAA